MSRVFLMNSAVMTKPGFYEAWYIPAHEFLAEVKAAHASRNLHCRLGYQQNVDFVNMACGLDLHISRENTQIGDGDTLLMMRLPYRTRRDGKHRTYNEWDFEFMKATYYGKSVSVAKHKKTERERRILHGKMTRVRKGLEELRSML